MNKYKHQSYFKILISIQLSCSLAGLVALITRLTHFLCQLGLWHSPYFLLSNSMVLGSCRLNELDQMINAVRITNKFKWDYKSQKYHKSHHANGRVFGFLMCIYSPCSHVWWNLKKKIVNILKSVFISEYKILFLVTNCCISSTFMNTCIYITVNSNFEGITRSQIFCS